MLFMNGFDVIVHRVGLCDGVGIVSNDLFITFLLAYIYNECNVI